MTAEIVSPLLFQLRRSLRHEQGRAAATRRRDGDAVHPEDAIPPHPLAGSRGPDGAPLRVWAAPPRLPLRSPSPVLHGDTVRFRTVAGTTREGFVVSSERRSGRLIAHVRSGGVTIPLPADTLEVVR